MKPLEIKGARARLGLSQQYMADTLGISVHSYRKKESGKIKFADEEKVLVTKVLNFTVEQMNDYLYDGLLPIGDGISFRQTSVKTDV